MIERNRISILVVLFVCLMLAACAPTTAVEESRIEPIATLPEATDVPVEPTSTHDQSTGGPAEITVQPVEPTKAPPESTETPTEPSKTSIRPTKTPAKPTETPIPAANEESDGEIALVYKRSGGYAGLDEEYTIYSDGRITSKDGREWWVDPQEVADLLHELEELGFTELEADYVPKDACCDHFSYELAVFSEVEAHTVKAVDGAPGAPEELWQALDLVQGFLDQVAHQSLL